MKYASTFLSHSSDDKSLVEAVANELGRRGIIAWLDKHDLTPGLDLCAALEKAIQRQATVCVFLSEQAVKSAWVTDELAIALEKVQTSNRIIPVYLGDPVALVKSHSLLRSRWRHPDGDRVTQFGICPKLETSVSEQARAIAGEIACGIYADLKIVSRNEVILYLDQRGKGNRYGEPDGIPENVAKQDVPALVFRPDIGERSQAEVLRGDQWNDMWRDMKWSLGQSIGNCRGSDPKKIRILGNTQLGLPFFLGRYFNRNTSVHLYCYNLDGHIFNNRDQDRHSPMSGGNAYCEADCPGIIPVPPGSKEKAVSLLLMREDLVSQAVNYIQAKPTPYSHFGYWVKHGFFTTNEQVMAYIADVVALLLRLQSEREVRTVHLFSTLPFHVLPLLAANLLHVVDVVFMEYRRDLQGTGADAGKMYAPLPDGR